MPACRNAPRIQRSTWIFILFLLTCIAVVAFPTALDYLFDAPYIGKPVYSSNGKSAVSILHYGWSTGIRMETSGIHPFEFGREVVSEIPIEKGWITGLTWKDDHNVMITVCFHEPPYSLPKCHWHNITILFNRDSIGGPPL